jgi:hypothetical protein
MFAARKRGIFARRSAWHEKIHPAANLALHQLSQCRFV